MGIAAQSTAICAPGQAWKHVIELARSKLLPVDTVFWDDAVTGNLGQHHTEGKDVSGLIETSTERFRSQVMAVTFTVNVLGSWPLASQAKIGNLESTLEINENVGRFQVQMDVARFMYELQSLICCQNCVIQRNKVDLP